MNAGAIDANAEGSRFLEFDSRAKIFSLLFFIVIVALLRDLSILIPAIFFILMLLVISGLPAVHVAKRYLLAAPFGLLGALSVYLFAGLVPSIAMFLRISTCVLALILLTGATPFFDLLKGLQRMNVPRIFVSLILFTYQYLFVISDEMARMSLARRARGARRGGHLLDRDGMRLISNSAGMTLVRAFERGKRMHDALVSRGYDGEIRTLTPLGFKAADFAIVLLVVLFSLVLLSTEWGLVRWA